MRRTLERSIGHAGQDSPEIRSLLLVLENAPKRSVSGGHKQQNGDDGAHREGTIRGMHGENANPSPRFDRHGVLKISLPRDLTTGMTRWRFKGATTEITRISHRCAGRRNYFVGAGGVAAGGGVAGAAIAAPAVAGAGAGGAAAAACGWAPGLIQQA
jgi:hypothetical protein